MTLTLSTADKVDIRRHMGFGFLGNTPKGGGSLTFWRYFPEYQNLEWKMDNLVDDEVALLQGQMIPFLNQLEQDIYKSRENLDTDKAAVWFRNDQEPWDRQDLYNYHRALLCSFMQLPAGPFFVASSGSMVRMIR